VSYGPVFGDFRDQLDRLAQKQYSAERLDRHDRARALRRELLADDGPIGVGAGRWVFALPESASEGGTRDEYVVKLALPNDDPDGRDGKMQNCREAAVWEATTSQFLVPVVAADSEGYWLVMPRGRRIEVDQSEFEEWEAALLAELEGEIWIRDVDPRNVVALGDELRLCDYGMAP